MQLVPLLIGPGLAPTLGSRGTFRTLGVFKQRWSKEGWGGGRGSIDELPSSPYGNALQCNITVLNNGKHDTICLQQYILQYLKVAIICICANML